MATTTSSGKLRRAIGQIRRRITEKLAEEQVSESDLSSFTKEEVHEAVLDLLDFHEQLEHQLQKLQKCHFEWSELEEKDPNEKKVKRDYIEKYGDYLPLLQSIPLKLNEIAQLYSFGKNRLSKIDPKQAKTLPEADELIDTIISSTTPKQETSSFTSPPEPSSDATATQPEQNKKSHSASTDSVIIGPSPGQTIPISMGHPMSWTTPLSVSLPRMTMPTFSGDISKYFEFKESFDSLMNHLPIDNLTKLQYLKTSLSGEAADLLRSLPLTNGNFSIALNILEEQYGGTIRIKHALLQKLRTLPDLSSNTNPTDLQHFGVQCGMIFEQLLSMQCDVNNVSTSDIIESKLPKRVIQKLYGQGQDAYPSSTKELIQKVKEIARIELLVAELHNNKIDNHRQATTMSNLTNNISRRNHPGHGNQNQNNRQTQQKQRVNTPCAFCVEDRMMHHPQFCRRYNTLTTRKQRAAELRLCYRCLQTGHSARQCTSTCQTCNGRHHTAICSNSEPRKPNGNGSTTSGLQNKSGNQQAAHAQPENSGNTVPINWKGNPSGNFNRNHNNGHQGSQWKNQNNRRYHNNGEQTHIASAVEETSEVIHGMTHVINNEDAVMIFNPNTLVSKATTLETSNSEETQPPPVIMMTITLPVLDKNGQEHPATIFFDSGSNTSYIKTSFSEKLQLQPIGSKKMKVETFGSSKIRRFTSNIMRVSIKTKKATTTIDLHESEHIATNVIAVDIDDAECLKLLNADRVTLQRQQKDVDILIGLDFYLQLLGQVNTIRLINGLQLHITDCGPILSGKEHHSTPSINDTFTVINKQIEDDKLYQQLQNFWILETIGIHDTNPNFKSDEEANAFFRLTTTRKPNGRYVVRLPYSSTDNIHPNRALCCGQLQSTVRRLKIDPALFNKYANIFLEYISLDFIEEVLDESIITGPVVCYFPHHPVIKETSKTTKIRIVYNGSAKTSKNMHSLNDHLHTGERLLPDIAGIFLRIRQSNILISADIAKAFLQLELHEEDRDATRFLWVDPNTLQLKCYRFKRVPFGLKSSPFLLNRTIRTHLDTYQHPIAKEIATSLYVDNIYMGVSCTEEAKLFYNISKEIFADAQMNLCQYVSNCSSSNEYFTQMEKGTPEDRYQKLLGIKWDTQKDCLIFALPEIQAEMLTKRKVLKLIASCYDPIGYATPVTLSGKLFFQTLTSKEQTWDTPLSIEQHSSWKKIRQSWTGDEWHIPRQFFSKDQLKYAQLLELHVFTDASKIAYGTVAYLRIITEEDTAETQFLMSKSRVTPIKSNHSIPQLEALALLTGVRLANYCLNEMNLPIRRTYVWSDSMCSLDSLQTTSTTGSRFVRNRLKEIQEHGKEFLFSHVPGKNNPADLLTRGTTFNELKESTIWLKGPSFLQSTSPLPIRCKSTDQIINATTTLNIHSEPPIDVSRFSTFHRLLRTVMVIIYFITRGKLTSKQRITRARRLVLRLAQQNNPPSIETINSLQLQKDEEDDLWIYTGRVNQKPLIFLPQGKICRMIILEIHQRNYHSSPMFTLSKLREEYWIPKGLTYTKRSCRQCLGCRRINVQPYPQPSFASFPDSRILPSKPFKYTGVDYAGPLQIKVNNKPEKVWILLFTCLYSRFIVTELVLDMTTSTFLNALRRLSSLFGTPEHIICDNAAQFHLLTAVINNVKDRLNQCSTLDSTNLPEFHFISPHAPWEGGVYERMISLIKQSLLRAGSTTTLFELDDFRTTLCECTNIVNCRPLTYMASEENIEPLRPIDFVLPHGRMNTANMLTLKSPMDFEDQPWKRRKLAEDWDKLSTVTEEFRSRWIRDYIQVLQHRRDFDHKQGKSRTFNPKVGDVVLIHQPSSKSTTWPLGRIEELKERSALVKNGRTKRIVEYPWKLLYPLENTQDPDISQNENIVTSESSTTTSSKTDSLTPDNQQTERIHPRRSTRKRTATKLFTALMLFSFLTNSDAQSIIETTTASTTSPTPETVQWISRNPLILLFGFLFLLYGLHGCITLFLCLHCITKCLLLTLTQIFHGIQRTWFLYRRNQNQSATLIVILFMIQGLNGCNDVASIQGSDDLCVQSKDGQECFLNKAVRLNIRPEGPIGCYTVLDNNGKEKTFVEVHAKSIVSTCNEKTHHFTRQFKINHYYSHRCAGKGSCTGNTCETLSSNDGVPEFPPIAMDGPGHSRCYTSCGCITCGGCISCSSSCLFSRISAEPTSYSIYEITQCPTWTTTLELEIKMNGTSTIYTIPHGTPVDLPQNMSITVTGFSTPPSPIHGATFIKRKTSDVFSAVGYTLSSPPEAGRPRKGSVGELQCPTENDAIDFNCIFTEDICTCTPLGTSIRCECQILDMETIINRNPINSTHGSEGMIQLRYINQKIQSRTFSSGLLSVQLTLRNYSIHRIVKEDRCTVNQVSINGCYSCPQGGQLLINCKSSYFKNIVATIECPTIFAYVNCSSAGQQNEIPLFANQPRITENCTVRCGTETLHFTVNGSLKSLSTFTVQQQHFINFQEVISLDTIFDDIKSALSTIWDTIKDSFSWIFQSLRMWIIIVCLIIVFWHFRCSRECRRRRRYRRKIYTMTHHLA